MKDVAILYPVFVQIALTFVLLYWMGLARLGAVRARQVRLGEPGSRIVWTGRAGTISDAFHNQLEVPLLFYAVAAFAMLTNAVDQPMVILAWLFVALRLVHAGIFVTYNKVTHRFMAFLLGTMVVAAMWIKLALHVLAAGA
jgi:hypothetical protein